MKNSLFKFLSLLLTTLLVSSNAQATHIVGGEVTYKYLGAIGPASAPFRYQVIVNIYVDRNSSFPDGSPEVDSFEVGIYRADNCQLYQTKTLIPNPVAVTPPLPPGCDAGLCLSNVQISLNSMTTIVDVPFNIKGYHVFWQRCCRNGPANLLNGNNEGSTFTAFIPSPAIFPNSSPLFVESGIPFLLTNDTATFANNAIDPDGDRLIYSFVNPYKGGSSGNAAPFNPVPQNCPTLGEIPFAPGYTLSQPFGVGGGLGTPSGSYAFIDPSTGFTKYVVRNPGNYVVTIEVKEFRTLPSGLDTLLTSTRRELQFIAKAAGVAGCPVNAAPVFKSVTNTTPTYTYTIQEGQAVNFTIRATDSAADSLYLTAASSILSGTNGYTGPLATFTNKKGIADLSSVFSWQTNCGTRGSFTINATALDRNCPPKSSSAIYTINVLPFKAPTRIFGLDTVCSTSPIGTYYVQTTAPSNEFTWKITGGTLLTSPNNDSVRVQWTGANTNGFLTLVQKTSSGCRDSITTKVFVRSFQTLVAKIPSVNAKTVTICQGQSVGLSATGSATGYRWTASTGTVPSPTSANVTVAPNVTTRYIVSVGTGSTITCFKRDTLFVNVIPRVADAGPATATFCSSDSLALGVAAASGYTYQWSPAVGVNFPTRPNPKVRIENNGATNVTIKYYVTATHTATACTSKDSITLTITPKPLAIAGTSDTLTLCSGNAGQLGAARVANLKYLWTPATGLDKDTLPNPTITLTNGGTVPTVTRYIIKVTNKTSNCFAFDTIFVKVKPVPSAMALLGTTNAGCTNQAIVLGTTPVAGVTYAWSPKAGLDDTTKANPTLIATSNGIKTYTLTVTDATGCKSLEATLNITISPRPVAVVGTNNIVCSGVGLSLGAASQTGITYLWSPATGLSNPNIANPTLTITNGSGVPQALSYKLLVSNGTFCKDSATLNLTVNPLPVAIAGATDTVKICSEGSVQLGAVRNNSVKYKWLQNTGLTNDTLSNPVVTLVNNGTTVVTTRYILQVTDRTTGCIGFDTIFVKVNPLPIALVGTNTTTCQNGTLSLGGLANANFTYTWSPREGLDDSTKANPIFTPTVSGTKDYTLVVKNNITGCISKPVTISLNTNALPPVVLGTNTVACSGASLSLGGASQAGLSYKWTPATGLSNATIANPTLTLTNSGATPQTFVYRLTVRNTSTQCKDSANLTITVNPLPVAIAGTTDTVKICSEGSVQLGTVRNNSLKYKWLQNTGLTDDTLSNPVVTLLNNGTTVVTTRYILQVTDRTTNCIGFDTIFVKVNPLPVALVGTNTTTCQNGTLSLGGLANTNFTYTWSPRAGLDDSTKANPIFTPTVSGSQTYTLVVKNNITGCISKPATISLNTNALPPVVLGTNTVVCSGASLSLGGVSQAGLSYKWTPATGLSNANIANPTLTLTNSGATPQTFVYRLAVRNTSTQCKDSANLTITVNPLPVAIAGATDTVKICSEGSVQLGAVRNNSLKYKWLQNTGLTDDTLSNPVVTLVNNGTTVVTTRYILQVTDRTTGCIGFDSIFVKVNPLPLALVGTNNAVCANGTTTLGGLANPKFTYAWSPKIGLDDSTKANPVFTPNVVGTQSYALIVTNTVTGCVSKPSTINVNINTLPPLTLQSKTATICSGQSVQIGVTTPSATLNYTWTGTGLSSNSSATPTATLTNSTTSPIVVTYPLQVLNAATGCIARDTVKVTVNPLPLALVGTNTAVCISSTLTLGGAPDANLTYAWFPKAGLDDSTKANPVFTPSVAGLTNYTLTVTDNTTGCKSVVTPLQVTTNPLPTADAGLDKIICAGQTTQIGVAPQAGFTYSWASNTGLSNANIANPVVTLPYAGTDSLVQTYTLTVSNASTQCVSTDEVTVIVRGLPSLANTGANAVATCSNVSAVLGADSIAGYGYTWSPATGLSSTTVAKPTVSVVNNGTTPQVINYTLTVRDLRKPVPQCTNSTTIALTVNPLPIVNVGTLDSLCSGQTIAIGAPAVTGFSYAWLPTTGLDNPAVANPNLTLTNVGQTIISETYTLTVTNNATNCVNSKTLIVRVNPLPIVNVGTLDSLCSTATITIGAAPVTGFSYSWLPVTGLDNPTKANPLLSLVNTTNSPITQTYTLTVKNDKTGCVQSATLPVRINPLPIPLVGATDSLCSGQTINIGAPAVSGFSYSWIPTTGISNPTSANPTLTLTNNTQSMQTMIYTLLITNDQTKCTKSGLLSVRIHPLPVPITGALDSLCSGQTISIGAPAVAGFSYSWSPANGLDNASAANPALTLINTTQEIDTVDYTLTVTNNITGCVQSAVFPIYVNPLPIANAGTDKTICSGESVQVGAVPQAKRTYTWTVNGEGSLSALNIANPIYTAINTTTDSRTDTLYLKVKNDITTCESFDTVLVNVYRRPLSQPILFASTFVCPNSEALYKIEPIVGNTYLWSVVGGTISGANNGTQISVNWGGANANAKVYLLTTNAQGCTGNLDSLSININPQLQPATPTGATQICSFEAAGQVYSTGNFPNALSSYTFSVQQPNGTFVALPSQLGNNQITVNWQGVGIGRIFVRENIETSTTVCQGISQTLEITILPSPDSTLRIAGSYALCEKTNASLYVLPNAAVGSSFAWTITPAVGAAFEGNINNDSVRVNWLQAGTYTLSVQEVGAAGCVGIMIDTTIVVNPLPSTILNPYDTLICPSSLNNRTYSVSGLAGSTYSWTLVGGKFANNDTTGNSVVVNWLATASTKTLTVKETSSFGCVATSTLNVPLFFDGSAIVLHKVGTTESNTAQVEVKFTVTNAAYYPVNGTVEIQRRMRGTTVWTSVTTLPATSTSYIDSPDNNSTTIYEYQIVGQNRCGNELLSNVHNTIIIDAFALEQERTTELNWNPNLGWPQGSATYEIYRSINGNGFTLYATQDTLNFERKNAADAFVQCYKLKAVSADGYEAWSNEICIDFQNRLQIMNVITPNGDGKNDTWVIENVDLYPDVEIVIHNRWGKKVYKTTGYNNDWNGNDLSSGTYFYEVMSKAKGVKVRGWLEILR